MTEIVVTAIIFVVSAAGILSTISSIRPKGGSSVKKLEAAYLAKEQIEQLRARVDARMWDDPLGGLDPNTVYPAQTINGFTYQYSVEDISATVGAPAGTLRKVTMNVTY